VSDLVSGVLTRISELEQEQLAVLIDGHTRWTYEGEKAAADCFDCDWTQVGSEDEVNAAADEHMLSQHPTPELRLCRAHRQIVELHKITVTGTEHWDPMTRQRVTDYDVDCETCGCFSTDPEDVCETLRVLAVGLGVVEEDR
jgi:hypothetical protein